MSNLTAEQRAKLPLSDFGDPKGRRFPILDQSDADAAAHLIGRAKGIDIEDVKDRIVAICRRKNLKPPAAWVNDPDKGKPEPPGDTKTMSVAAFSLPASTTRRRVDGEYAVYEGVKVFEAGDYKDVSVSPEQLWVMAANTGRVNGNLEHAPHLLPFPGTIVALDGLLGHMDNTRVSEDDPYSLLADVYVPLPVDEKLPPERSVSVEFLATDPTSLTGYALTTRPRANVDVLMSAYADFAGSRHSAADMKQIQQIHDIAANQGAECKSTQKSMMSSPHQPQPQPQANSNTKKEKRMSLKDKFIEFFSALPDEEYSEITDPAVPVPSPDPTVRHEAPVQPQAQPDAEKLALMSRIEALETERRTERATNYVDGLIREGKLTPAARADFIATFSAAERVDSVSGTEAGIVMFSDGSRTSLTAALKRGLEALPRVVNFSESVPAYALPPSGSASTGEMSLDEKLAELAKTDVVLAKGLALKNGTAHANGK